MDAVIARQWVIDAVRQAQFLECFHRTLLAAGVVMKAVDALPVDPAAVSSPGIPLANRRFPALRHFGILSG
jgi:hypothetical protein